MNWPDPNITAALPWLAIAGRIVMLGFERIFVKRMGGNNNPFAATFLFFAIGAVLLLPFVPWDIPLAVWKQALTSFGAGLIYAAAFVCYVHSLSIGEASLVSPLYNINVLFLAVIAFLLLGEPLTVLKVGGLLLMIYGVSFLNRRASLLKSLAAVATDRACRYMVVASLLIACGRVVDKYMVSANTLHVPPLAYCFMLYCVVALYVFIAAVFRGGLRGGVRDIGQVFRQHPWSALCAGAINGYSYLFLLVAMTTVDVSVAEPASMLSVLVTLLVAHQAFGESVGQRLIGSLVMVAGATALFL